jgi:small-conductance mechanosensitive channel/CRP-like cAMP-binding protein
MIKNKNILLLSVLILLVVASSLVPISLFPKGSLHIALQVLKGILLMLSWGVFYSLIKASVFERYKHVYKKEVPRIILVTTKFLIFICAFLSIVVFVLGQSVLSIVALGGLVSAGLTFALGELILDAFSGVILETESPFEINDWIKTLDGDEGRVIKINWRTVILETLDEYLIIIPHRKIAQGFTNYSKPQKSYWDSVEITLDHTVPVERAERILRASAMVVPSIYQQKCEVTAMEADEGGITYEIRYMIPDLKVCRQVKHDVIESATRHLHQYKLKISDAIGAYAISKGEKPFQEESPLTIGNFIKKVDIFSGLDHSEVTKLSETANRLVFYEGEKIVTEGEEGQSMFLIGEGIVEISIGYQDNAGAKKEKKLFQLGFPEYFGEMALLLNEKRSATVRAVMNTVVYEISQDVLKLALKDNPKLFEKLVKQAIDKREKNKLTKSQMERLKEKKTLPSKGLLTNFKKFFQ